MDETISIQAYTLGDYTLAVINAVKQGYTMSLDNDKYPYSFGGGSYFAIFAKPQVIPEAPIVDSINKNIEQNKDQNNELDNQPKTTVKSNRQSRRSK